MKFKFKVQEYQSNAVNSTVANSLPILTKSAVPNAPGEL